MSEHSTDEREAPSDDVRDPSQSHAPDRSSSLRVSLFDAVTSLLMSLMLMLGSLVMLLVMVWLLDQTPEMARSIPQPEQASATTSPDGFELDFQEPGVEEVEQLLEITLAQQLEAVTEAVSTVAASPVAVDTAQNVNRRGKQAGDSREPGPNNQQGVPRFQRWQLKFEATNRASYAKQLDHFGIELAAIGGGRSGVDYASSLSSTPQLRHGASRDEKRLYFLWRQSGPLVAYDRQLLGLAGVELSGRQLLKFIPETLENQLAAVELEYARSHGRSSSQEIATTVFLCEPIPDGYHFRVVSQRYRRL